MRATAFKGPLTDYKPAAAPITPFMAARQEWDNRIGNAVVQAANWRRSSMALIALSSLLIVALVLQAQQQKVIPVVVGLDKKTGEPMVVGRADGEAFTPGDLEVKYFLSNFIRLVRSVPLDPIVIKQNWIRSYAFLTRESAKFLDESTQNDPNSPLKQIGQQTVTIQPLSVVQNPGTSSYQVRWQETTYSKAGYKVDEYTMAGTFIIEIKPPESEQQISENPLGIFIKNYQWNREL